MVENELSTTGSTVPVAKAIGKDDLWERVKAFRSGSTADIKGSEQPLVAKEESP